MKKHRRSGGKINKGHGQLDTSKIHVNLEEGCDNFNTLTIRAEGVDKKPLDLDLTQYPELQAIVNDTSITVEQRKVKAQDYIRALIAKGDMLKSELKQVDSDIAMHETTIADAKTKMAVLAKLKEWVPKPAVLEKNDCSRAHKLVEAIMARRLISIRNGSASMKVNLDQVKSFVIQHNWSDAFKGASDYTGGEIKLPFPECLFELRITGRTVIVYAAQAEAAEQNFEIEGLRLAALCFVECDGWWLCGEASDRDSNHGIMAWLTIRAVCIALDAEVATHEVVREPSKLNAKRLRDGKAPLKPYHIVNLAKRHRVANQRNGTAGADYTHKRLHFRRGHWRHYEASKTWIKWCLVGDPDLGFVDKEYRL